MRYILASASPRRKELLKKTGISFEIIPSSIEERITKTIPSEIVMELAEQKARAVYESLLSSGSASLIADVPESRLCGAEDGDLTVICADTMVV